MAWVRPHSALLSQPSLVQGGGSGSDADADRLRLGLIGAKATTGGVSMFARQMEHSCSRRWTASNSRSAKACLKPAECMSWRVVAKNLAISCQSSWRASGRGTSRAT